MLIAHALVNKCTNERNDTHMLSLSLSLSFSLSDTLTHTHAPEVATHLGLPELKQNDFHIKACTAKPLPDQPPDPRLNEGLQWLLSTVSSLFPKLDARVQQDAAEVRVGVCVCMCVCVRVCVYVCVWMGVHNLYFTVGTLFSELNARIQQDAAEVRFFENGGVGG